MERKGAVKFKGNPLTLIGEELKTGAVAPDFKAVDKGLKEVSLKDFAGKTKIISVTPSLDTSVCDAQARRFNLEATSLPGEIAVINMSMDLPFAIGRFCTTAGIEKVTTLSDHREASFGLSYGVLIKELRLLARSIFVIDADNRVRYAQIVPEVTDSVDFDRALAEAKGLLAKR